MLYRTGPPVAGWALFPVLIALVGSARPAVSQVAPRPNVLLILADDLGWSDLGCYGSEIRTPHLDALAKGGLRFTHFYNSARCSPTRASLLTGVHPHPAGFPDLSGVLSPECVTLPEVLKPAGYRTSMVGKWHLSRQSTPLTRGFDEFYGMLGGFNTCWEAGLPNPQIAGKPLRIHCDVEPEGNNGVILAQGGNRHGYALYLRGGRPTFTVRIDGRATTITSEAAVVGRFNLTATLQGGGLMTLSINGRQVASGQAPGLNPVQPQDELTIGEDGQTAVGEYSPPHPLPGRVTNIRINVGTEQADPRDR